MKQFFAGLVLGSMSVVGASAATVVNGSLSGPVANGAVAANAGEDALPDGWQAILGNPDTVDENNNSGFDPALLDVPFQSTPSGASPDGGTWVGMGRDDADAFEEVFGQQIDDFVVGQTYRLSWYAGNFGADLSALTLPCYCETNGIFASLDGAMIGMGGDLTSGSDWFEQSLEFTATSTSHLLAFGLTGAGPSYMSIDGISVSAIPLPAGGVLLLSGVAGFAALRRRARR